MKRTPAELSGTLVKGEDGAPLIVYRGERDRNSRPGFHTRLPSLSFGSLEAAQQYAEGSYPETASDPRIFECYLNIQRPLFNREDPFIEFPEIVAVVGFELALKLAIRYQDYAMNTDNWRCHLDPDDRYHGVADLYAAEPDKLEQLYTNIFPILDDPEFVVAAKAAGYDGAIYNGTGANLAELEYRIFDASQAYCARTGKCFGVLTRRERERDEEGLTP
ncbi:hypothetical protein [Pseudomonas sp. S1(2024)]|uniref:hypothetical protein n=1 Tax=Pseudomonas sp. S1(2024) TaxID=3390191 RepID=UPI00397BC8D2